MSFREEFEKNRIIVIARGIYGDDLMKLSKALYEGGIRFMEVTFDQCDSEAIVKTSEAIKQLKVLHGDAVHIGAGTVLDEDQLRAAVAAGAEFIVSPNCDEQIVKDTKKAGLISIPGAMTPTEIVRAHKLGADMVKLFPSVSLGLDYIKDILTPLRHIPIVAAAGVTEENFEKLLTLGIAGAGISGRLTDRRLLETGDYEEITRRARAYLSKVTIKS